LFKLLFLFPDYWFTKYKMDFFLFDCKAAAAMQVASRAPTCHIYAAVAVGEGSLKFSGTYFVDS
jgi:hypothetical protein